MEEFLEEFLLVDEDSNGNPVVYLPLFRLWDLLRVLPSGLATISYDHEVGQAKVSLPGLRPPTAQQIINASLMNNCDSSWWNSNMMAWSYGAVSIK